MPTSATHANSPRDNASPDPTCRVWVIRHAEAKGINPTGRDLDRELTPHGHAQAAHVAERIRASEHTPKVLLSSPAVRARTTATIVAATIGLEAEIEPYLRPDTAVSEVIDLVAERASRGGLDCGTGAIVGHNPTLEGFLAVLIEGVHARPRHLQTGEAVLVRFDPANPVGSGTELERHRL